MKKLTSAVLGLSLTLGIAGLSFAQAPATQAPAAQTPAKEGANSSAPAKPHVKKHKKAASGTNSATPEKQPATPSTPSSK